MGPREIQGRASEAEGQLEQRHKGSCRPEFEDWEKKANGGRKAEGSLR